MVGVIWYRFVRYSGTDWSDTLVPIRPLLWYRLERCAGTDSSATVVPIRRYYQLWKKGCVIPNDIDGFHHAILFCIVRLAFKYCILS